MTAFFGSETSGNSAIHFPAAGTRFKPASPAGLRAQTIPASGLFEKPFEVSVNASSPIATNQNDVKKIS